MEKQMALNSAKAKTICYSSNHIIFASSIFFQTVENSNFNFNGDYKFNQGTDKDYSDGITITKNNFVINGNNHIIDCANQARAFYITGKNVEINNLIIQNAFCGYGSAIGTDSKLTLNNVTFINCMGDNETYDGGPFILLMLC